MTKYVIRRLLLIIPTLLGITIIVFSLTQLLPGGPVEQYVAQLRSQSVESGADATRQISQAELENIRRYFGFDRPVHERYLRWLTNVVRLDFGQSFTYRRPAWDVISERMPISLFFGLTSLFLSYLISLPLGLAKAVRNGGTFDAATSSLVMFGYVVPGWALGILLITFLAGGGFLQIFPMSGVVSDNWDYLNPWQQTLDFLHHMVLPLFCYMTGQFAVLTMLMKNSVIEELNKDYYRASLAKGVSRSRALWVHAFRNATIPLVTGFAGLFSVMFTGALLIERVFDIDGMGLLFYNSVVGRDYNVVMALLAVTSLLALLGRLFSDLMYSVVDPRIRLH